MSHFITEWYFFLPGYQEVVLSVDRFCSPVQPVLTSLSSVFKALESFSVLGSDMKTLFLELYSSFGYFTEGISAFLLDVAQLCCQFVHCFVSLQTLTLIDWVLLGNDLIWNQVFRGWNKRDRRRWFPAAGSVSDAAAVSELLVIYYVLNFLFRGVSFTRSFHGGNLSCTHTLSAFKELALISQAFNRTTVFLTFRKPLETRVILTLVIKNSPTRHQSEMQQMSDRRGKCHNINYCKCYITMVNV